MKVLARVVLFLLTGPAELRYDLTDKLIGIDN